MVRKISFYLKSMQHKQSRALIPAESTHVFCLLQELGLHLTPFPQHSLIWRDLAVPSLTLTQYASMSVKTLLSDCLLHHAICLGDVGFLFGHPVA